ncbi:rRNA 2'-O-methyltransferase fibrillarin [Drosophila obscura]|uniref:rRNA 2'-O-methyltransferase fibrillarin n=1 Tax=Drosophila obscura TaxID=7282 RepID=UPI000BA01EE2|nr:rRNA 2'-O-methyltransferase fibrillarin [Drosophila obscura]
MPKKYTKKKPKGGKRNQNSSNSLKAAPAPGKTVKPLVEHKKTEKKPIKAKIVSTTIIVEQHRHSGIFLARNKDESIHLLTRNMAPRAAAESGNYDYKEQRFSADFRGKTCEFRAWSPFQSTLAAAVMSGVKELYLKSGSKVLYLGAGLGRTVAHISDIVDQTGVVYAVEPGPWALKALSALSERRPNFVPVLEDPSAPYVYHKRIPDKVDMIICNLQPAEQVRTLMLNARHFLKINGHFAIFLHAESIYDNAPAQAALEVQMELLGKHKLEPLQLVPLDPYFRGNALVVGVYTRKPVRS